MYLVWKVQFLIVNAVAKGEFNKPLISLAVIQYHKNRNTLNRIMFALTLHIPAIIIHNYIFSWQPPRDVMNCILLSGTEVLHGKDTKEFNVSLIFKYIMQHYFIQFLQYEGVYLIMCFLMK